MSEDRPVADSGDVDEQVDDLLDLDATDDEPELPEIEQEEAEQPPQRRAPPDRENVRFRQVRQQLRQQQEDNRRLRQSVDQLLIQQRTPPPDPYRVAELQRAEQERLAMMQPHEQAQYYTAQAEQRMQQQYMRGRLEVGDMLDQQNFAQLCREEPALARYREQVEQALTLARQQNLNPTREALANQMYAQDVRTKSRQQTDRQRRAGRAAIARETTQPGNGRSTVAPQQRRPRDDSDEALVARLKGVTVGDLGW